jgi:putative FmdB family regulatory protein
MRIDVLTIVTEPMPLYEYECEKCGHRFEKIQKFSDRMVKKCPECGGKVEQMISAPAVQFKGSGWYVTDYAKKSTASGPSDGGGKDSKKEDKSKSESSATESSSRESSSQEGSSRESSSKENSSKESSSGENSAKERSSRDNSSRENSSSSRKSHKNR